MRIKGFTFIGALVLSSHSLAQPTLITDMRAGDTWLKADLSKVSFDYNFNNTESTETFNADNLNFNIIAVSNSDAIFTPYLEAGFNRLSIEPGPTRLNTAMCIFSRP